MVKEAKRYGDLSVRSSWVSFLAIGEDVEGATLSRFSVDEGIRDAVEMGGTCVDNSKARRELRWHE